MRKPIQSEHQEQKRFFELVKLYSIRYPDLEMIAAVPNGGLRHKTVGKKLKEEGVQPGYPDIIIDVPRNGYHGARIEMKRRDGGAGLSAIQLSWSNQLIAHGYMFHMAKGCDDAWAFTLWYLNINL